LPPRSIISASRQKIAQVMSPDEDASPAGCPSSLKARVALSLSYGGGRDS